MRTAFCSPIFRALGQALLLLLAQQASAACTCDPDVTFNNRAEWAGPYSAQSAVDVNLGNTPEKFIEAAYWQIAGVAPTAAFVTDHANRLRTWGYWRRIDTVNTILTSTGNSGKTRNYSDAWTSEPALTTAPCKNQTRDVGAVWMLFFNCPAPPGYNCGMQWANNHAVGMQTGHGIYGGGLYDRQNVQFYQRELMDARYAGLQFLLPNVYGWEMADGDIDKLKTALDNIAASGVDRQVKVGLFDDTWGWGQRTLGIPNMADTNGAAQYIFDVKWAPYFDRIPDAYRYKVAGKPMIYMYNAGTINHANAHNVFARLKFLFNQRYGTEPFLAADIAYYNAAGAANMGAVADAQFTWKPGTNLGNGNSTTFFKNGITLSHSMPRWDPIGRDSNGNVTRIANNGDGIIKGGEYLANALNSTTASTVLVFATWNDLGEGTGINRSIDYYHQGAWLRPTYFMDMIRASQSGQTCGSTLPTATRTPTISPTFSLTTTPTHGPLVADMEQVITQDRTLWNGGAIVQYKDANGTTSNHSPWTPSAGTSPGYGGTGYAACWAGTLVASSPTAGIYPYSFLAFEVSLNGAANAANGGTFTNVLPYSTNKGIQFAYKASAAGVLYQVEITTSQVADYGYYAHQWVAPDTNWNLMTVYFPDVAGSPRFAQPAWAVPRAWDPTQVGSIIFQPVPQAGVSVAYGLCIDNLTFAVSPAPTYTPTRTPSPTATRTVSPSPSRTASPSLTRSPSPSASPTATSTPTTLAASATVTPTGTRSATSSATRSASPSATGTVSATRTASPLANTATQTPTSTRTSTGTFTRSSTATGSPSRTPSPSPSRTASASATPSSTTVPVGSSPTATPTISATATRTSSATPSSTPSATATQSGTPSATGTRSPSGTQTPVNSPTSTSTVVLASATPSSSPVNSPVESQTATPTGTVPTLTATPTGAMPSQTASPTLVVVLSGTSTFTATSTASPSATPTHTIIILPPMTVSYTFTPSPTVSSTPVPPTATATRTRTPQPSLTPTCPCLPETFTPTRTATRTATPPSTATPMSTATASPTQTTAPTQPGPIHPPHIEELLPYPNPQRGGRLSLRIKLKGPADGVQIRCFSRGMNLVASADQGASLPAGWSELQMQHGGLPAGAYFVQVRTLAREGRGESDRKVVKLMVLP